MAGAGPAAPQTTATAAAASDNSPRLGEVIVTAQRRSQNLRDVPISVSVASGATIQTQGINTLEELSTQQPNFNIADGAPSGDQKSNENEAEECHQGVLTRQLATAAQGLLSLQGRTLADALEVLDPARSRRSRPRRNGRRRRLR